MLVSRFREVFHYRNRYDIELIQMNMGICIRDCMCFPDLEQIYSLTPLSARLGDSIIHTNSHQSLTADSTQETSQNIVSYSQSSQLQTTDSNRIKRNEVLTESRTGLRRVPPCCCSSNRFESACRQETPRARQEEYGRCPRRGCSVLDEFPT